MTIHVFCLVPGDTTISLHFFKKPYLGIDNLAQTANAFFGTHNMQKCLNFNISLIEFKPSKDFLPNHALKDVLL